MYSPSAEQALSILRQPGHFEWTVVPIFVFVIYFYFLEINQKNWNIIFAGLAYYGIEWLGEIANSLIMHFSNYAPLWGEPGKTSFLILVGINIETTLMFGVFGLAIAKVLPKDAKSKIFGVPNRLVVVLGISLISVIVETALNKLGALTWDYWWWGWPHIWSVILFAYTPAALFTVWIHDMASYKKKSIILGSIYALDIILFCTFVGLNWI